MSELDTPKLRAPLQNSSSPRDQEPVGIEKLMKWQDERVARRLRGEYESAVMHLSEVVRIFTIFVYTRIQGLVLWID
jgi:outer membrane protein insertion porin family